MANRTGWSGLARPVLRSGLHVVRRDDAHLQIGLDEPDRLVLRDRPGLLAALTALDHRPPEEVRTSSAALRRHLTWSAPSA